MIVSISFRNELTGGCCTAVSTFPRSALIRGCFPSSTPFFISNHNPSKFTPFFEEKEFPT